MPLFPELLLFITLCLGSPEQCTGLTQNPEKDLMQSYPSLFYEVYISGMNQNSEIGLFYDERVQSYINLYLTERRNQIPLITGRARQYFPVFEKYLREFGLPLELRFLPVIESALDPYACSPSQAVGLWQFKDATARAYGLRVDATVDERTDPELSTRAACRYLSELYKTFGDWHLALLAYNAGPGNVRNAIKSGQGPLPSSELSLYLSPAAQNYLPALVAVIYLFTYPENHF